MIVINNGPLGQKKNSKNLLKISDIFHIPNTWLENVDYKFFADENDNWELNIYSSVSYSEEYTYLHNIEGGPAGEYQKALYPIQDIKEVSCFLVGAGQNGNEFFRVQYTEPNYEVWTGHGGNGGECITKYIDFKNGEQLDITIGENINTNKEGKGTDTSLKFYHQEINENNSIIEFKIDENKTIIARAGNFNKNLNNAIGATGGYIKGSQNASGSDNDIPVADGTNYFHLNGNVFCYGSGGGAGIRNENDNNQGGKDSGATGGTLDSLNGASAISHTGGGGGGSSGYIQGNYPYSDTITKGTFGQGGSGIIILRSNNQEESKFYTYTGESKIKYDSNGSWIIEFLTSGLFKITNNNKYNVDIHAVGGGGGGGMRNGSGGGGGYINTVFNQSLDPNKYYYIHIGEGGDGASGLNHTKYDNILGEDGENSYFDYICLAEGGKGGGSYWDRQGNNVPAYSTDNVRHGGAGSSGGGAGGSNGVQPGAGGNNNQNGEDAQSSISGITKFIGGIAQENLINAYDFQDSSLTLRGGGGAGGGNGNGVSTMSVFADTGGSLGKTIEEIVCFVPADSGVQSGGGYGGYGDAGAHYALQGKSNTGGGGGGIGGGFNTSVIAGKGGSGIVLLRNFNWSDSLRQIFYSTNMNYITNRAYYDYIEFLSSGTFFYDNPQLSKADIYCLGGGGGGGYDGGGGGGSGFIALSNETLQRNKKYLIKVGLGGNGAQSGELQGENGKSSSFDTLLSVNGGQGGYSFNSGAVSDRQGGDGGSGGGPGGYNQAAYNAGDGGSYGSNGLLTTSWPNVTSGSASTKIVGNGQNSNGSIINFGYDFQDLSLPLRAGGGGGGAVIGYPGKGGINGGGDGGTSKKNSASTYPGIGGEITIISSEFSLNGSNGEENTGGGGGGGAGAESGTNIRGYGGNGGSGIVIIRFPKYLPLNINNLSKVPSVTLNQWDSKSYEGKIETNNSILILSNERESEENSFNNPKHGCIIFGTKEPLNLKNYTHLYLDINNITGGDLGVDSSNIKFYLLDNNYFMNKPGWNPGSASNLPMDGVTALTSVQTPRNQDNFSLVDIPINSSFWNTPKYFYISIASHNYPQKISFNEIYFGVTPEEEEENIQDEKYYLIKNGIVKNDMVVNQNGEYSENTENKYLYFRTKGNHSGLLYTTNPINLTNYTKLCIELDSGNRSWYNVNGCPGMHLGTEIPTVNDSSGETSNTTHSINFINSTSSFGADNFELNINNITGNYYPSITVSGTVQFSPNDGYLYIKNWWLE